MIKFDTYNETDGYVSESWDISESPNSNYIWYLIDGEICPKLFGVGDGKQKEDDGGGDNKEDENNSIGGGGGNGKAEIREELPVSYGIEIDEPDAGENNSSESFYAELPELKPLNSLLILGLFALGISAFVIVWRRNEDDDSTV